MSRPVFFLLLSLAISYTVTTTQGQCVAGTGAGYSRCGALGQRNDSWVSNVTFTRTTTSAQIDWLPDLNLMEGIRYQVVWRNVSADENFTVSVGPRHPNTGFTLTDLVPSTTYEVLACLQRFDISTDLPAAPLEPLIPECGFCLVCFETVRLNYEYLGEVVSRVNETHVNFTCQIEANVDFNITWTYEAFNFDTDAVERVDLFDGNVVEDGIVTIQDNQIVLEDGTDFVVTSVLTAPEFLVGSNVQCMANSAFGSSEPRDFNTDGFEVLEPAVTIPFPVWGIALLVVVPMLLIIILLVILLVVLIRHSRKQKMMSKDKFELKQRSSNTYLEASHVPVTKKTSKDTEDITSWNAEIPEEMIIDSSLLDVSKVIGQGEFGVVYRGVLRRGSVGEPVAVKSLKGVFVSENDVQSALKEISKMKNFDHPNVMTLVGVCRATAVSGGAPSIVMPFMAKGSLLNYLRNERESLIPAADADITQIGAVQKLLMQMCLQISKGMAYLASLRFVHRDLAARNCMIDEKGVIKVADFGLAEDIYMRNYFRQSSQDTAVKLPLKWMAPESIKLGIFSEKSDVWSYGVTCWEVFSGGEIPYPGIHPREVVQLLEDGEHLTKPKNKALSDSMFSLVRSCWSYRSEDRPTFGELVSSLDKELTTLADYIDLSMFAEESNVNTASEE